MHHLALLVRQDDASLSDESSSSDSDSEIERRKKRWATMCPAVCSMWLYNSFSKTLASASIGLGSLLAHEHMSQQRLGLHA